MAACTVGFMGVCITASVASGQSPAIYALPGGTPVYPQTVAYQIAADGSTVVGMSIGASTTAATAWSNTGTVVSALCCQLGAAYTHSSDDGQVLIGWIKDSIPGGDTIARRPLRLEQQFQIYDIFSDNVGDPNRDVLPRGTDASGRFIAFWAETGTQPQVSRIWDSAFSSTSYSWPAGTFEPTAMNASATLVAGFVPIANEGACWTSPNTIQSTCAMFAGPAGCPTAQGLSDPRSFGMNRAGSVHVGTVQLAGVVVPARMAVSGGGGIVAVSACEGVALDASLDASVIVGQRACSSGVPEAFIWTSDQGTRSVVSVLAGAGVNLAGWVLTRAAGISDDARIIAGEGTFNGETRGWVAHLPPLGLVCDSIDFNNDGSLFDPTDVDALLSVFSEGPCLPAGATCNDIDFNNDGSLFDPADIDAFLSVFSEGPCI